MSFSDGAVPSAGMPAMNMPFSFEDSPHLAILRVGDTVDIQVANRDGIAKIRDFRMDH